MFGLWLGLKARLGLRLGLGSWGRCRGKCVIFKHQTSDHYGACRKANITQDLAQGKVRLAHYCPSSAVLD